MSVSNLENKAYGLGGEILDEAVALQQALENGKYFEAAVSIGRSSAKLREAAELCRTLDTVAGQMPEAEYSKLTGFGAAQTVEAAVINNPIAAPLESLTQTPP